jgi:hypothetical protein
VSVEPQRPEREDTAPDLVGRTSARLLAAGVDRRERLAALHLLAVLDASIDLNGRVRRPLDDLAAEFELAPLDVLDSLEHLERAGAIQRDGAGVVLLGASPDGLGGMQLADFLDDVRASFDDELAVPRRNRWLARSGAVLVAAAAMLAISMVAPSTQPTVDRQPLASGAGPVSTTIDSTTSTSEAQASTTTALERKGTPDAPTNAEVAPIAADTAVVSAGTCPTGSPVAEFVDDIVRLTNPSSEDITVNEIAVGDVRITSPITIPAGESVEQPVAILGSVETEIVDWVWTDETVARSCPS